MNLSPRSTAPPTRAASCAERIRRAAAQLQQGALLVNPYDIDGTASAIARAVDMPESERRSRMRKMRRSVREHDVFWWLESFLAAAQAKRPRTSRRSTSTSHLRIRHTRKRAGPEGGISRWPTAISRKLRSRKAAEEALHEVGAGAEPPAARMDSR